MNIKTADGEFVAVTAPPSVTRVGDLKVGNHITATYNNNVVASVKPWASRTSIPSRRAMPWTSPAARTVWYGR